MLSLVLIVSASGTQSESPAREKAEVTTTTLDPDAVARANGYVALCNDGGYSDNDDFTATCSGGDGVAYWLAPFGECSDGTVISMEESSSCGDHGGFSGVLDPGYRPTATPQDVALCKNGVYSDNLDLGATCSSNGGVARWLADYGECEDGTVIELASDDRCGSHGGFRGLLPVDFVPVTTAAALPTTSSAPTVRVPLPAETLTFLDLDGCDLDPDGWWRCRRGDGVLLVTDRSDPVAVFAEVQTRSDYNEITATLFAIDGGGILYLLTNAGFEMFDVAPWPGLSVIDTDCIGVPADPSLC